MASVLDSYHSRNTQKVFAQINGTKLSVYFTYTIRIHFHSGDVYMEYRDNVGRDIQLSWRERIRHDISFAPDTTVFTYPSVYGPGYYSWTWTEHEDRYGDGYNALPYQTRAKYFWDAYSLFIKYGGTGLKVIGTVQSDRVTCYKTVSCKFT